jgi:hypothetical protein
MRLGVVLLAMLLLGGCRHQVRAPKPGSAISFRNCRVTAHDASGGAVACDCGHFHWEIDAHTGQTYAACEGGR